MNYKSIYSRFPVPRLNPDNRTLNRKIIHQVNDADALTADNRLRANWRSGRFEHTFLAGLDYQKVTLGAARGAGIAPAIDVYAPVYGNFTAVALGPSVDTDQRQTGVYVQHQLKFDARWIGVAGLRHDWAKSDTANAPAAGLDTEAQSKRLGIGYLAPAGWTPYASYSESFSPITGVDLFGAAFKPQASEQLEAGVKYQPPGFNSLYTFALYDIRESNRRTADPNNPGNQIQIGEARSKGVEVEGIVAVSRDVDVLAAYAYTDARVTRDNSTSQGKRLATVPEHTASVWGRYRFALGDMPGFVSGIGVRYIGESWDGLDQIRTPGVTLFDAMLGYDYGHWRITLTGTNLANRSYVSTCLSRGDCFYGSRRSVVLRTAYRF